MGLKTPSYVAEAFDLIDAFSRGLPPEAMIRQLLGWLARFGASSVLVTGLPHQREGRLECHILLNGWPAPWHQRYTSANLYRDDPCVRHCLTQFQPFAWSELPPEHLARPAARRVMHEAAEFDLRQGLCIPIHDPFGFQAVLTTAGRTVELPTRARHMAHLLAMFTYTAAGGIRCRRREDRCDALTRREQEVLRWAGAGKTCWETATILGISDSTVEKHLRTGRDKLGTATTRQAVVEALRRHLIQL